MNRGIVVTFSASVRLTTLNPSRRKSAVDNSKRLMVNKHTGLIILWVLSLQSTLSDDSTFPKKSLLIMKALFEVESNCKGIMFFPLKLFFFFFF